MFQEYPKSALTSDQYVALKKIGFQENVTYGFMEKHQFYTQLISDYLTMPEQIEKTQIKSLRRWLSREKTLRKASLLTPEESKLLNQLISDYEQSPLSYWKP